MRVTHLSIPLLGIGESSLTLEIPCMGIAYPVPGEYSPSHTHQTCELHFVKRGELDLTVGKRTTRVTQGTVFFVNAGVEHEQRFIRRSIVYYMPIIASRYDPSKPRPPLHAAQAPLARLLTLPWCACPAESPLAQCFERIRASAGSVSAQDGKRPLDEILATLMRTFAVRALEHRATHDKIRPSARAPSAAAASAARAISTHFASALTVRTLARDACMSVRNFEREFKAYTGDTPREFLMETRLRKALEMLRETTLKIDAIITLCGFRSRDHFYRYFARRIGASPESYRRNSTRPVFTYSDVR